MTSQSKRFGMGYWLITICVCLSLSCSKNEDSPVILEQNTEEDLETVNNDAENTVTVNGNTYILSYGDFEDWGLEYPNSRQFAIDLYSENYSSWSRSGIMFGIYLNSPSLSSFTFGTYKFEDLSTTPGGIMDAGISVDEFGLKLVSGWINVEQEGENYRIKWIMRGGHPKAKISGHYYGPLTYYKHP